MLRTSYLRVTALGVSALLACGFVFVGPSVALANDSSDLTVDIGLVAQAFAEVDRYDETLILEPKANSGVGVVTLGSGHVDVPADPGDNVEFVSPAGETLGVGIPGGRTADDAVMLPGGVVTYPAQHFASSVIIGDSRVQMVTTIADSLAPTEFSYEISLREGQSLQLTDQGPAVMNADGSVNALVAKAWAVDAAGQAVDTRYVVHGATLVQIVDHVNSQNVVYPVVADPIWLAPWVIRCLTGIGLNGSQITQIASAGTPLAILGAFGYAALRCVLGR